jgi:hypothetical protein
MSESIESYIRSAGLGAAVPNMVINPAIAWLTNRRMEAVPLIGSGSVVMDTAITCVLMTLIVALFTASATRRGIETGHVIGSAGLPRSWGLLSRLPQQGWALGLTLGVGFACTVAPLTFGLFSLLGVASLPFAGFAVFKAVYTPLIAFVVVRWVILRQLLASPEFDSQGM